MAKIPRPRDMVSGARSLAGIVSANHVFGGPRSVALAISNVCNTNCLMCFCHSPLLSEGTRRSRNERLHVFHNTNTRFMEPRVFEAILRECRATGTFRVVLGGNGDPAIHPAFDQMLELMMELDMEPYVLTNGLALNEERLRIWSTKRAHFRFSIHAGDEETWLRVHPNGRPGQFERLSHHIKELSAGVPRVSAMHVIHKANFRGVRSMVEHAREVGFSEILFRPVRAPGPLKAVVLDDEEERALRNDLRQCQALAESYGIHTNMKEYLENSLWINEGVTQTGHLYREIPCYIGWIYAEFDLDGTMRPCLYSKRSMGKVGERPIEDMWNSPEYWAFRWEARNMPRSGRLMRGCACNKCCMAKFNVNIHNLLHLKSFRYAQA